MAVSLRASEQGLDVVDEARRTRGWNKADEDWCKAAQVTPASLKRFWLGNPIKQESFVAICQAVGVGWQKVADLPNIAKLEHQETEQNSGLLAHSQSSTVAENVEISKFYVERPPVESQCYEEILQPGALIRIKAPKKMGKSWLLYKVLNYAATQGYPVAPLNFLQVDRTVIEDLDQFLRWFCSSICRCLKLPNQVNERWDEGFGGSTDKCSIYFEDYLLAKLETPLVLGLDNVDRIFSHPEVTEDFFRLLRTWYEDARNSPIWKKLRLVLVHSTEDYVTLDINHSPFSVGLAIELPEFTTEQVKDLAQRHELNWKDDQVQQLMAMVGGHPYLVDKALSSVKESIQSKPKITLEDLLQAAPTEAGIYDNHLREHLFNLQQEPKLADAMKKVLEATKPIQLDTELTFKLHSMGLVIIEENRVKPRCQLYHQYLETHLNIDL